MAENVKLAENVILVDVAYFNDVVKDLKRYFELQLGRPLQNIYVEEWASIWHSTPVFVIRIIT